MIVSHRPFFRPSRSPWISEWCAQVIVVPEQSRISVLSKGSENASMTSMPFGGHMVIAAAPSWPNSEVTAPSAYSIGTGKSERSEEHTSELQSLMRISYAVFCLKKKKTQNSK